MKSNEIFIIGGALLAAIVLFKGQASSSASGSVPFISPFLGMLGKAETKAIQTLGSNIETLQSVKQSNLGIAQNILDQERSLADVRISQQQTELDKTQGYISQQQKIASMPTNLSKNQSYWASQLGGIRAYAERIIGGAALTQNIGGRNISDGRFEDSPQLRQYYSNIIAQENIGKANEMVQRQQGEIDRLNEEYQTRFGSLSRYG